MGIHFSLTSSDPHELERAKQIAIDYAKEQIDSDTVGIAFLGSIVRGYYDQDADIDISIFRRHMDKKYDVNYETREGFELHTFTLVYWHIENYISNLRVCPMTS